MTSRAYSAAMATAVSMAKAAASAAKSCGARGSRAETDGAVAGGAAGACAETDGAVAAETDGAVAGAETDGAVAEGCGLAAPWLLSLRLLVEFLLYITRTESTWSRAARCSARWPSDPLGPCFSLSMARCWSGNE